MELISNHKRKIEEQSPKSSMSSSKVVGLEMADLWEFQHWSVGTKYFDWGSFQCKNWLSMYRDSYWRYYGCETILCWLDKIFLLIASWFVFSMYFFNHA